MCGMTEDADGGIEYCTMGFKTVVSQSLMNLSHYILSLETNDIRVDVMLE